MQQPIIKKVLKQTLKYFDLVGLPYFLGKRVERYYFNRISPELKQAI